jgi:hypothetical protein
VSHARTSAPDPASPFFVPPLLHLVGGCVEHAPQFWLALGRLEAHLLAERLRDVPLARPIFVCGLARSGSTLLHEILAAHPAVASHRVGDFPMVFTPFWWRQATRHRRPDLPRERAHGDRMLITPDSPDALEEMIWMAFFPGCHNPAASNVLPASCHRPDFEAYYRAHLRKLLLSEGKTRYAAKANYHVARLGYLQRLFPDARFLIPVREPVSHIGSLMRQHQRFSAGERRHPRARAAMRRAGHFEFGLDRRPINLGDTARVRAIESAWAGGDEVLGWAHYWAMVHEYLADRLAADASLRAAALVVRHESFCAQPGETLAAILGHAGLPDDGQITARFAPRIGRPDYYQSPLTHADQATILKVTAGAAARLGGPALMAAGRSSGPA